jgi:phosphate-selective porin OprO/OprP
MSGNGLAWQTVDQTASTTSPENSAFDAEVVSKLEERLAELEAKFADSKKEAEDSSKEKSGDKKGTAQESTAKWNVRLGGHVQLDFVHWADSSPSIPDAQNYFEFRRLRLVADGTGYDVLDFRLQMTLEPETIGETTPPGLVMSPDVKDAYLSVNEIPTLGRFRIGNFFVPFSLEQVTNDTNNAFLERSIPTQGVFSPDREVGMAFYNSTEDKNATISYGIFLDSISEGLKEKIDDNQGFRLSSRATWLPYYDEASKGRYLWHTGVGILHTSDQDSRVRFRSRPQIREGPRIIDSGPVLADE